MKMKLTFVFALIIATTICSLQKATAQNWNLNGNKISDANKLGSTNLKDINFITDAKTRMTISTNGNVAIGRPTPISTLDIKGGNGDLNSTEGDLRIGNSANRLKIGITTSGVNAGDIRIRATGGSNRMILGTNNADVLTINNGGGITIADPGINPALYSSASGTNIAAYFQKTNTSGSNATVVAFNAGNGAGVSGSSANGHGVYGTSTNSAGVFGTSTNSAGITGNSTNAEGVYGYSTSKNGIGGYSPNGNGVFGATGNTQAYAGYFAGPIFSTTALVISDEKFKTNIKDFSSAMNLIGKLQPKQYQFSKDSNYKLMNLPEGSHYGLIAQDVEKVLPILVKETKFETKWAKPNPSKDDINNSQTINFKALNYTELIPIIIKGMQEQQAVIDKQQEEINELKQRVNQLSGNHAVSENNTAVKKTTAAVNNASLEQNAPNPFNQTTIIKYRLPINTTRGNISITSVNGRLIKSFSITSNDDGKLIIEAGELAAGIYNYALTVNGKLIDTKKMALIK